MTPEELDAATPKQLLVRMLAQLERIEVKADEAVATAKRAEAGARMGYALGQAACEKVDRLGVLAGAVANGLVVLNQNQQTMWAAVIEQASHEAEKREAIRAELRKSVSEIEAAAADAERPARASVAP